LTAAALFRGGPGFDPVAALFRGGRP
jgi:hypothetical protein